MRHERIAIEIDYHGYGLEPPEHPATLVSYVLDRSADMFWKKKFPAVIICPGGGYEYVAPVEGEPVALRFNGAGVHAFVLEYSCAPARFPGSLLELSKAVAHVRAHAQEWNIDEHKIVVCGFSAGGHLAASLGVYWREGFLQRFLGYENEENRPDGLILGYSVLSSKAGVTHAYSAANLLGKSPDEHELALFSVEENVSDATPPTFLWHTADDGIVPCTNSLLFAQALQRHEIPFELHIYPHGEHSTGLGTETTASFLGHVNPDCQGWFELAVRFISNL